MQHKNFVSEGFIFYGRVAQVYFKEKNEQYKFTDMHPFNGFESSGSNQSFWRSHKLEDILELITAPTIQIQLTLSVLYQFQIMVVAYDVGSIVWHQNKGRNTICE